jgi:hypothetical protein
MANSIKRPLKSGAWLELTAAAVPAVFDFSNIGVLSVFVQYGPTSAPAVTERGHLFKPGQGDRLVTMTRVWARVEQIDLGDAEIYVNEA